MNSLFQNSSGGHSEHPLRETLLLFVDGELPSRESAQLEAHLEACWPCRVKTKKLQEAIANIIEFDEVLTPHLVPPQRWRNFDRELGKVVAERGSQSLRSRVFGSLSRFFPVVRLSAFPRPLSRQLLRNTTAVLMLVIMVGLMVLLKHEPIVSANELLKNAIDAQAQQLRAIHDPVVHQNLHVRRKDQVSANEESVNCEIWNDTRNSRVRQVVADSWQPALVPTQRATSPDTPKATRNTVLYELAQVLESNHMDPQRPLSAASYQSWHNTLQHQQDEVTKTSLAGGIDALKLRTVPPAPLNIGQIAEAEFIVRANDWQPTYLRIDVVTEGGNRTYELFVTVSEIMTLAQVNPAIFADHPIVSPSSVTTPRELDKETQPTPALPPHSQPLLPSAVATADLEVEALRLLNEARADLGEQISVKRNAGGRLEITGIVETDERKAEIIDALSSVASSPAVRIEIQTVAEAVAKQTLTGATPSPSVRAVEINSNTMAAEPELRAYFADRGKDTDEAVRGFAARMVSLSNRGMDHLWAMKRLLNQFSAEQVRALTPEARDKWLGLIRTHARSYLQTNESLCRELKPIFFPSQPSAGRSSEDPQIVDANDLSRAVEQLFEQGSSNDRVIRSAFTSSRGGVTTTVIKAPQFWQSLKNAEAAAARIATSK